MQRNCEDHDMIVLKNVQNGLYSRFLCKFSFDYKLKNQHLNFKDADFLFNLLKFGDININ